MEQLDAADQVNLVIDKTTEVICALAEALSVPAQEVWRITITQMFSYGVVFILAAIITALLFTLCYKRVREHEEHRKGYDDACDGYTILCFIFGTASFITLACGLLRVLNPEYYAIFHLISLVTGGTAFQ